jgi:predicted RNase H-like HicB family nuclease
MKISGILECDSSEKIPYYVGIPELEIHSQGATLEESYEMIKDAFGLLLKEHTNGNVTKNDLKIISTSAVTFDIVTDKIKEVSSFAIHRLKTFSDFSQKSIVKKMGKTSRRSLTAYEYGKSEAGLSKFQEILSAIGYDIKISFIPKDK